MAGNIWKLGYVIGQGDLENPDENWVGVEEENFQQEYVHICLDWDSIMLCFTANRLFILNGHFFLGHTHDFTIVELCVNNRAGNRLKKVAFA